MQAYQCSVVVEVGVDGSRISIVFGQAEMLRQKHESTRDGVVDVPMAFPIVAILVILRVVVWLGPVDMFQNHVEQMAHEYGSSERRVRRALESVLQRTSSRGQPTEECSFRSRKMGGDLANQKNISLHGSTRSKLVFSPRWDQLGVASR